MDAVVGGNRHRRHEDRLPQTGGHERERDGEHGHRCGDGVGAEGGAERVDGRCDAAGAGHARRRRDRSLTRGRGPVHRDPRHGVAELVLHQDGVRHRQRGARRRILLVAGVLGRLGGRIGERGGGECDAPTAGGHVDQLRSGDWAERPRGARLAGRVRDGRCGDAAAAALHGPHHRRADDRVAAFHHHRHDEGRGQDARDRISLRIAARGRDVGGNERCGMIAPGEQGPKQERQNATGHHGSGCW